MKADERAVTELKIQRNAIVALHDIQDVQVECREGSLWITVDRDLRDVVLGPGERFGCRDAARVLVSALAASSLRIVTSSCARPAAARAAPTRRLGWVRARVQPRIALI